MNSNKRKIEAQNDTPSKRKVNWLSLSEKLEVIKRSDEGATQKPDFCNLLGPVYNIYITSILAISILAMFFLVPKIAKIEG